MTKTTLRRARLRPQRRRRCLHFQHLEARRVLATVSGTVFEDVNLNGTYEQGTDVPLQFETVFVDLDHNGVQGDTARQVEPDLFVDTAILTDRTPGLKLRGADQNNRPTHDITANVDAELSSTGTQLFGRANVAFFNFGARFRADFEGAARSVEIDFIGGTNFSTDTGQLEIYNKDDVLLDTYTTSPLNKGEVETMTLSRVEGDIAYAVAFIPSLAQGSFGRLDNFRYNHLGLTQETGAITDANGDYTLTIPDDGEYSIVKELDGATIQTGPTNPDIESVFIPVHDRTEHVYDVGRGLLYIGTTSGRVERYHVASGELLTPLIVGGSVEAIDISPDGDTLYIGETTTGPETGLIREVDVTDGSVILRTFPISGFQGGVKDLVATGAGKLLFSIKFNGSSSTPLFRMDLATGAVTTVLPAIEQNTLLERSGDYSLIFIHGSNSSGNTIMTYDPATDSIVDTAAIGNASGAFSSVNFDGSKIAYRSFGNGFSVFHSDLTVDDSLPHFTGGAVFDARGEFIFAVDKTNDELVALDTATYSEQFRIPLGEDDFGDFSTFNRTTMTATPDGRQVFVNSPDGMRMYSLAHLAPYRVDVQTVGASFVDLDFGGTTPSFDPTQPGSVSGKKWHDENADGQLSGESGLEDWRIYADVNRNGVWDASGVGVGVGITIEPDDFEEGFVLNRHFSEVTLMTTDANNTPQFKVTSVIDNQRVASTGIQVFSHAGVNFFNNTRRLRMDFNVLTRAVAIDFVGSSTFAPEFGRLDVFDAADNLLESYDTRGLWNNQVERMHISRPTPDMAYAVAYSPDGMGNFGRLDNLWFAGTATVNEPNVLTDDNGDYQLSNLPSDIYDIREEPQAGWQQSYPIKLQQGQLVTIANVSDHVFNPTDDILYITTTDGDIQRYDTINDTLLAPWGGVGTELTSIDITPDGSTLYVGDAFVSAGTGFVRKVDVATGNVTNVNFTVTGAQEGVRDIAIGANNNALFSITFSGSSSVPLFHLDTSTDVATVLQASVEQNTLISRGVNRELLFIHGSNSHPNTIQYYDAVTGAVTDTAGSNNVVRARSAVNPAGDAAALRTTNGGLAVLDDSLNTTDLLAYLSGPMAYDPVQQRLYVADDPSNQIVVFDTANNHELYRINIEENFATDTFVPRVMSLSGDGQQLFLSSATGIHIYDARAASAHRVVLDPGESIADVQFGNTVVGNIAPIASSDSYDTDEEQVLNVIAPGVLANDLDFNNDTMQAQLVVDVAHGDLTLNSDGSFTYAPDENFAGTDIFIYRASDGALTSGLATVAINIANVNDPPTDISLGDLNIEENSPGGVVGSVSITDNDPGDSYTYVISDNRFEIVDGDLRLRSGESLNHESEPTIPLDITATDAGGASIQKSFTLHVLDENEFHPVVTAATFGVDENSGNGVSVGTVLASDGDTSQSLSYAITNGDANGVFAIDNSGVITVAKSALLDHEATSQFILTVEVTDDGSPARSGTATATVNVQDLVGFLVIESDGASSVSESGATDTFTVVLTDNPVSNVVFDISSSDTGEASVSHSQLTFTPANWDTPQTVTITGEDDFLIDGQQTSTLTVSIFADDTDDAFDGLASQSVSVTTDDNDTAGISVVESGGSTSVSEAGTSDTLEVSLTAEPDSDVVLMVISSDLGEAMVDVTQITFRPDNWDTPQTITVTGQDDSVLDGAQNITITLSVDAGASDDKFDGLASLQLTVEVLDDDAPGFTIQETDNATTVAETGTTDTFDVTLNAKPASDVVLTVASNDPGEATVNVASLTFTPDNWNTPQTVTVTGEDDPSVDGSQSSTITLAVDAALSDDDFDAVAPQTVSVTTTDDDAAGYTVSESEDETTVAESATEDTITVVLTRRPLTDVRFLVTSSDLGEAVVSVAALVFTPDNWETPQSVTVTGVDDPVVDGSVQSTITIAIDQDNTDDAFDHLADTMVDVTTQDNDSAGFIVTQSDDDTTVSEAGATDDVTVALAAQPLSDVVFHVSANDPSEATVAPQQLTFTSENWNVPQTILVTGQDDSLDDDDQLSILTISIDDPTSDDAFDDLADATVLVTTLDDDVAGVTVTESADDTTVSEAGSEDTFAVVLDTQPTSDVVLQLTADSLDEAAVSPLTMTFTPENWDVPQTATVTGVDDSMIDGSQQSVVTIAVDAASSEDGYDGVAPSIVDVTTTDDDAAGFQLVADADILLTESGSTSVFSVVLTAQPNSDVVLAVGSSDPGEAAVSTETLTFTALNWDAPQEVTITGVDEELVDGEQTTTITISVLDASSDDNFDPLADQMIQVKTEDDDVAGFLVTESGGSTVVTEAGGQDTLEVVLTAQPLTDVILNVSTAEDEVLAGPTTLTFTMQNWNVPQTVTLTGQDDVLDDDDQTTAATVAVNSQSDGAFHALPSQSISVVTIDDDERSWHNHSFPEDVNNDGALTVGDLRIVFTHILAIGTGPLDPEGPPENSFMVDVDNNLIINTSDLRIVFSQLLSPPPEPESAEGETAPDVWSMASPDTDWSRKLWELEDDWWLL